MKMHQNWKDFLIAEQAHFIDDTSVEFPLRTQSAGNHVFALAHLTVLTVSGKDAAQLLQGQITCNINDITESKGSLGAFCNAKGRAITTFLLVKLKEAFALILPVELLETVRKKLQMYILRANVTLTDGSEHYCLTGFSVADECPDLDFPRHSLETVNTAGCLIKLPSTQSRYLMIAEFETVRNLWVKLTRENQYQPQSSNYWRYQDILSGIPWLTTATSEEFIPQMLNLDKLGGISFNKGCYTGQEIIARTHFLGKSKRALYLAESDTISPPAPNTGIMTQDGQPAGKVLQAQVEGTGYKMLVVLSADQSLSENLMLADETKNPIRIITL